MKMMPANLRRSGLSAAVMFFFVVFGGGSTALVFAHGGEDHGDEKPKTVTTGGGMMVRSTRLGDLEVMLKHPPFAPDTATTARLFITEFATNEAFTKATPALSVAAANGVETPVTVEKSETAGVFNVKFPALPQGEYTLRAALTYGGETDTATFPGVEVKVPASATDVSGGMSWARTLLIGLIFLLVVALFGGLIYFILQMSASETVTKETVSA